MEQHQLLIKSYEHQPCKNPSRGKTYQVTMSLNLPNRLRVLGWNHWRNIMWWLSLIFFDSFM